MNGSPTDPTSAAFDVHEAQRGTRLDHFLQERLPRMSRSAIHTALAEGRIELASGLRVKASRRLMPGDRVVLFGRRPVGDVPERPQVIVEGRGWQVIDKPSGMPSIPSSRLPGRDVVTLTGMAPAHRLDRFTTGCLLLTDEPEAARHFVALFTEGLIEKQYAAIVWGEPERSSFTCELPIGPSSTSRVHGMVVARHGEDAQPATTRFHVAGTFDGHAEQEEPWSLVRAQPLTGRRHQVRVHAAAEGHPLVGDLLHGGDEREFLKHQLGQDVDAIQGVETGRFLLHARRLAFQAPDGAEVVAEAPWPLDFPLELTDSWDLLPPALSRSQSSRSDGESCSS